MEQNQERQRSPISLMPATQPLRATRNTSKKDLEARKRDLQLQLDKVTKMLELIEKNPEIEEFLDLQK